MRCLLHHLGILPIKELLLTPKPDSQVAGTYLCPQTKAILVKREAGGGRLGFGASLMPRTPSPQQLLPYLLLQQPAWDLVGIYLCLGLTWPLSYTIAALRREHVGCFSCICRVQVSVAAGEILLKPLSFIALSQI